MRGRLLGLVVGVAFVVVACGGGDDGVSVADATVVPTTTTASSATAAVADTTEAAPPTTAPAAADATTAASAEELPKFLSEFDRVCKTQVGFAGAAAYDAAPGVHPAAVLEDAFEDDDLYISYSGELPAGWAVAEDANFDDNAELAATQLVACIDRVATAPTGTPCEFESDGQKVSLELTNATYEVKVFEAATGKPVGSATLETSKTECPIFVTYKKGDTQTIVSVDTDALTNALEPYVSPS